MCTSTDNIPLRSTLQWLPTLYFAQGFPLYIALILSTVMYKSLGMSNTYIVFIGSLFYLPWSLKPLLSCFIEGFSTKRQWIIVIEIILAVCLLLVALSIELPYYTTLSFLMLLAFCFLAAMHDISIDGYYLIKLNTQERHQTLGYRNGGYECSQFVCNCVLVAILGWLELSFSTKTAWALTWGLSSIIIICLCWWHKKKLSIIEEPQSEELTWRRLKTTATNIIKDSKSIDNKVALLCFIFVFNCSFIQYSRILPLYFLDSTSNNGLSLSTLQLSQILFAGACAFVLGSFLLSFVLKQLSLRFTIFIGSILAVFSSASYLLTYNFNTASLELIVTIHTIAQLLFGFANCGYIAVLIDQVGCKKHPTALFSLLTSFMCASYSIISFIVSVLIKWFNYRELFLIALLSSVGVFVMIGYWSHKKRSFF